MKIFLYFLLYCSSITAAMVDEHPYDPHNKAPLPPLTNPIPEPPKKRRQKAKPFTREEMQFIVSSAHKKTHSDIAKELGLNGLPHEIHRIREVIRRERLKKEKPDKRIATKAEDVAILHYAFQSGATKPSRQDIKEALIAIYPGLKRDRVRYVLDHYKLPDEEEVA